MHSQTDILHVADTIENQLLPSYFDQLGVSDCLAQYGFKNVQMIIAGSRPVQLKIPVNGDYKISFKNLLSPAFKHPNPLLFAEETIKTATETAPRFICMPHTMRGCGVAAFLSYKMNAALISGVDEIIQKDGKIVFIRNVMNGKWVASMLPRSSPCIFTVNQGAFTMADQAYANADPGLIACCEIKANNLAITSIGISEAKSAANPIENAEVVIAAGRGIQDEENLKLIQDAAGIFKNAAMGASRPICDAGWLPYSHQIGETGKQIAPKVYIACGISGANQHINGIKQAQTVVAINTDPQAAIFRYADIGIIERVEDFLPVFVERSAVITNKEQ